MKVLQINAVYRVGSTGRNAYELHKEMLGSESDSYIAATHMNGVEENCVQIGSPLDWKLHGLLSRLFGLQGYFSFRATKHLLRYMDKISPDVVHLNNLHGNYINLGLLFDYLAKKDIATVITLHDCWFYTGKCMHYTAQGCSKWKTGCSQCPKLKMDNRSWFFDRTPKMWADRKRWYTSVPRLAVVGVSDWITGEARQSVLGSAAIIRRIYNWIDLDVFQPCDSQKLRKEMGLENKFIILGVASQWGESKGLQHFSALSSLLKEDEVIILVGKLAEQTLAPNIIHVNATENVRELVEYYSMADVFLQLSLEETFGKVVAEALACGTPVITVDSTANAELVPPDCGIVNDRLDMGLINNSIAEVRKKGKKGYADRCRTFAEENFNMQSSVGEYMKLYSDLLSR